MSIAHHADMARKSIEARFGERVRELRQAAGLSQEKLAFQLRLSRPFLSQIEGGGRNVSIRTIEQIARGLKVPLRELMDL